MAYPILSANTQPESKDKDAQVDTSPDSGNLRFWKVRGTKNVIVDIEKAREAMRHAMRMHAEARKRDRNEDVED